MSIAQTYDNFAEISGAVGTYPGAESALFAILAPLTGNFITLFYEFNYVVAIWVLIVRMAQLDVLRGVPRLFFSLVVVSVLMYPVRVSVPNISRDALKLEDPLSALSTAKLTSAGGMSFGRCGGEGCITLPAAFHVVNYLSTRLMVAGMAGGTVTRCVNK